MKSFFEKHKFIIGLFLISFLIRLIYVLIIDTPIISDFEVMYNASLELINKTRNYYDTNYFILWGYQMGHVIYQSIILTIWRNFHALELINTIITSFTVVYVYKIARLKASEKSSRIISILYMIFPFSLFMNTLLSNQQLPLLLMLIAVYKYLKLTEYKTKDLIVIGLLLGISNILRSEAIVIILALILYSIILIKKIGIKNVLKSILIIYITYSMIFNVSSYLVYKTGLTKNGLKNMNPYWKFVLGLNTNTNGRYSNDDAITYSGNIELSKEETFKRIKKIDKLPELFIKKTKILWLDSDLSWPLGHISDTKIYNVLNKINQLFIYLFVGLSILSLKNIKEKKYLLIFLILFIYFGVYLFIEIQSRYAYNLHAFLAILAAYGFDSLRKKES